MSQTFIQDFRQVLQEVENETLMQERFENRVQRFGPIHNNCINSQNLETRLNSALSTSRSAAPEDHVFVDMMQ